MERYEGDLVFGELHVEGRIEIVHGTGCYTELVAVDHLRLEKQPVIARDSLLDALDR